MASGDNDQSSAPAGDKGGGSTDQEMQDDGNNIVGGNADRDDGNKAVGGKNDRAGAPAGQGGNNTNIGTGGLTADEFTILLSLRLKRPPDDSHTKVIADLFHALLIAQPKAQIPPQLQYAKEIVTLAQPTEVPNRSRFRFYVAETGQSCRDRGGY